VIATNVFCRFGKLVIPIGISSTVPIAVPFGTLIVYGIE